jgi:hypothetical protein
MAQIMGGQIKLNNGQIVTPQQGGWYDGRQFWGGTLSDPGVINNQSNQVGAGQAVSSEVNRQSDAAQGLKAGTIDAYLAKQRASVVPGSGGGGAVGTPMAGGGIDWTVGGDAAGGGTGGLPTMAPAPSIDLNGTYQNLYDQSGINELQKNLSDQEKAFIEAKGVNNDNPFLNEASRVGKEAKLTKLFDERTANIRNDIATKKADVETQLQLQLKQFDINSQQAKQSFDQFQTLLQMGALDNASGEDIANITRSTGIGSDLIKSAIMSAKKAKADKAETKFIESTDDAGNVTVSLVRVAPNGQLEVVGNQSLGQIAKKTKVAAGAKPSQSELKQAAISDISQVLDTWKNSYGHVSPTQWSEARSAALQSGLTTTEFNSLFAPYTDPNRSDFNTSYGFDPKTRGANQYQIMSQGGGF